MSLAGAVLFLGLAGVLFFATLFFLLRSSCRITQWLWDTPNIATVPWSWPDAVVIGLFFFSLPGFLAVAVDAMPQRFSPIPRLFEPFEPMENFSAFDETDKPFDATEPQAAPEHPLTQLLLATQKTPSFFLIAALCVLVGVIAVPITEEFVFRLLFQGAVTRFFPGRHGLSPLPVILIPAAAFAMIHARKTTPLSPESLHELVTHMMILPVAYGGVLLLGIGWLRLTCRATAAQLGWNPRRFFADLARGGFVFLLFLPLMITLQLGLGRLFPEHVTDPIPIFFLAIYLGLLTYRTGRITPAIGLHMALNLFSFNLIMCRILL